jgi:hypothetical protein
MPYDSHTVRNCKDVIVEYDEKLFEKVVKDRWHVYEKRPLRDVTELFSVMRKVVNSDASRLEAVRGLMKDHAKLIVFYNFDYELEILRSLAVNTEFLPHQSTPMEPRSSTAQVAVKKCPSASASDETTSTTSTTTSGSKMPVAESGINSMPANRGGTTENSAERMSKTSKALTKMQDSFAVAEKKGQKRMDDDTITGKEDICEIAEWNGHKHQEIPDTDRWVYLVQYTAGSEGWNCIDTDAVCFYSLTYSFKQYHQAHGRIDRLNTPFTDLWYYTLLSHSMIDLAVWKSLMGKQSFNESSLSVK